MHTPVRHELESRLLELDLTLNASGQAQGTARLDLSGECRTAASPPASTRSSLRFRPTAAKAGASDVRFAAFARGFFLGDYQGLTGGRIVFTPFWISTFARSARSRAINQPDAYTRTVRP